MSDLVLEVFRSATLLGIFIYLWVVGKRRRDLSRRGWNVLLAGFALLLFGSFIDVTDNFETLNRFVVIGDTQQQAFLEKVIGYLGGFVLVAIGLVIWIPTVTSVDTLRDLNRQLKKQADSLRSEQELLKQMFIEQERERKLISYEIHDGIVQYATGALMLMEASLDNGNGEGKTKNMVTAAEQMRKIVEEGRRLMNGLRPLVLDEEGLVAAIEHLISEQDSESLQITLKTESDFERIDPRLESCIYRVVQEAITNAKKHSQTKKIQVVLGHDADRIHVEIRDWGIGFNHDHRKRGPHGLLGMTERVQLLGGNLLINCAAGKGTSIRADLPILVR